MPVLDWIGKKAVVNHHREVSYRLLHCDKSRSIGDKDAGNLLVQGDNLEALKALLPYYAGKVKCIYIDPPYNTGNEGWIYNDNVSSPEIQAWLGKVVGKEAEDLSRHDKWLCMMYPRLRLLREFLTEDGSIWVSIDDNEGHYMKALLDEIFGRANFIATAIWQRLHARNNSAIHFSADHEFILVYARNAVEWRPNKLGRTEASDAEFWNPDNDPRGLWRRSDLTAAKPYSDGHYAVIGPHGDEFAPRQNRYWSISRETFEELKADNRLWWGKTGRTFPFRKRFKSELGSLVPTTIWLNEDVGDNREAKQETTRVFGRDNIFDTPKPERLIRRIIEIASQPGDCVMDSFAGSGTTGVVAHKTGRRHLMIEIGEHAQTHTGPRLKHVVAGTDNGTINDAVGWKGGGGFRFCTLGEPLFDAEGNVSEAVVFSDLAAHVFFCDTGSPIPKKANGSTPLIGTFQGRAIYLLFSEAFMGVPATKAGNVLTAAVLKALPAPEADFNGTRVVYGEGCTVPDDRLAAAGVVFRQVPYQIEGI
ncbi:site-specific DNA-methyltransferase [Methylorubrum zatmanii]|nr:site-specific DNA-methyltransferase [Methylorubrum zatmanii]ARO52738.1 site-specific DNA-methyltransferase [Methylorubrum zatmanii]